MTASDTATLTIDAPTPDRAERRATRFWSPSSTVARYLVEGIGTLFLVFTVGASVRGGSALAPLAIGGVLMAMIYAGGHISGGHFNPAVTVAALVRGRIKLRDAAGYWVAQLVGGLLGAGAVLAVVETGQSTPIDVSGHAMVAALVAELLFTFALCYVVLNVATSKDHPDNSFYGLAIGFTVVAGAVAVGGVSGAAFNPAVVLGGVVSGLFSATMLPVYVTVQVIAGVAAGLVFRTLNPDDK
ncbi:aquaporin [Mycobacterium sp. CVI_P3]|uniref:Aquaporin n=1 Tax=Mycobacterium pinniadriaticum TaxID=2994102 RepID=A0ABT3SD76_9MYCO|nr:aquaporin [Mycobacterium pinniadriaticum]MCX2931027.1 aquaporin [Mycobacterium pinniadriaticum]MCX2937451.1 aquaporin [Mycobacterium pinniadriaticum]